MTFVNAFIITLVLLCNTLYADYAVKEIAEASTSNYKYLYAVDNGTVYFSAAVDGGNDLFTSDVETGNFTRLTFNTDWENFSSVDNGQYVWYGPGNNDVHFFDGTKIIDLNPNGYQRGYDSDIDNGQVAYTLYDDTKTDCEIYLYDGTSITQITHNDVYEYDVKIDNGEIAWSQSVNSGGSNIVLWKDGTEQEITTSGYNSDVQFDDGIIVWVAHIDGQGDIKMYKEGVTTNLSNSDVHDRGPVLDNGKVAWTSRYYFYTSGRYGTEHFEIHYFDGTEVQVLTDQELDYRNPQISNGEVVFHGQEKLGSSSQIFHYNGAHVNQVTFSYPYKSYSRFHNGVITWSEQGLGGTNRLMTAQEVPFVEGALYKIINKHSGKALDLAGSFENGANVQQWDYRGGKNQLWNVAKTDKGYKIVNALSGKALDIADWASWNGGNIHQWDYVGGDNQQWNISELNDGSFKVTSVMNGKALEVADYATWNGANIQQWDYDAVLSQQWEIVQVPWEFRWVYEDANNNGAWDYSWAGALETTNFLFANEWTNLVMSTEEAYEGTSSLKIALDHGASYTDIFIPTSGTGDGNEPTSQGDFDSGKDISKANVLSFNIKGTATTNFTVILLEQDMRNSPSTELNYQLYSGVKSDEWSEVNIPMDRFYSEAMDYSDIAYVWIRITPAHAAGHMEFYIDNLKFKQ